MTTLIFRNQSFPRLIQCVEGKQRPQRLFLRAFSELPLQRACTRIDAEPESHPGPRPGGIQRGRLPTRGGRVPTTERSKPAPSSVLERPRGAGAGPGSSGGLVDWESDTRSEFLRNRNLLRLGVRAHQSPRRDVTLRRSRSPRRAGFPLRWP